MDGRPPYVTTRLPGRRLSYLIHNAPGDVHPQELTHAMQSTPSSTCLNLPYSYRLVVKTQVQDQGLSSQSLASSRSHVLQQQQRKQSYFCCTISGLWGHNGVRVSTASGRIWPHTPRNYVDSSSAARRGASTHALPRVPLQHMESQHQRTRRDQGVATWPNVHDLWHQTAASDD